MAVSGSSLRKGDVVLVEAGDVIPGDGEVIEGVASVDESAITGESAPVIRESGGDRSAVTGGTRVLSDWLIVRISANPGEAFLDRMIAMVEGAKRQKTPNEIALNILLAGFTIIFLLATATLLPYSIYSVATAGQGTPVTVTVLVALLVCLIPTTIGGPPLGDRHRRHGPDGPGERHRHVGPGRRGGRRRRRPAARQDRARSPSGNRQATAFLPADGVAERDLADAAQLASLADETPEGRSIVVLAKQKYADPGAGRAGPGRHLRAVHGPDADERREPERASDPQGRRRRHRGPRPGAGRELPGRGPGHAWTRWPSRAPRRWSWPTAPRVLGVIQLKDIVKGGIRERFGELRKMGIKTVMITGDNPLTAAAIAAEAGVDDFLAQATPETKLKLIREYQAGGRLVAMTGDGTNDAPALAQADVAVAMNSGTQAAKEAGNMVDLDSNPTKLIEVVETGKQMLMTRGALTTFSIANDVAKYFAIIPAAFATTYPALERPQRHGAGHAAERDPVGGDLQRADHHRPGPAGPARRPLPARWAHRRCCARFLLGLRRRGHRRAVRRASS